MTGLHRRAWRLWPWMRVCGLIWALAGCASVQFETTGQVLSRPLCEPGAAKAALTVLWGPVWRPDQKEPPLREAAALKGMTAYFEGQACAGPLHIRRVDVPADYASLSGPGLIDMARAQGVEADRVILLVVRELGPKLRIGIPMVIAGGTEVVVETQVADRRAVASMAMVQARLQAHWQKGGPFYIKGVKTLDQDMRTVLSLLLDPPQASPSP